MSNSFFAGLESFIEENPVDITESIQSEDQIEIQQDIADAKEDVAEFDRKIEKSDTLLCQLFAMREHIENYGLDRTFLAMFNRNGELAAIVKCKIPSCEAFDVSTASELAQVCCEGIDNAIDRVNLMFRDDFMKLYSAIRRAFQSWTSDAESSKNTLIALKTQLKNVKKVPNISIKAYTPNEFKKWISIEPIELRKKALNALHKLQTWSYREGSSDKGAKIADSLEEDIKTIEKAEPKKETIDLTLWSTGAITSAIDYAIKACNSINETNKTYEGFWKTGFNQGKVLALFGMNVAYERQNVIRVARTSWRNLNTLCSIDDALIHTVIRMAKAAVEQ